MQLLRRSLPALLLLIGCQPGGPLAAPVAPPSLVIGAFLDDYQGKHTISNELWIQEPGNKFHVVRWVPELGYLIAQNDSSNRTAPGKWTRIDWVRLSGMAPYEWAFCFSAYDAPTRAVAETVSVANRAMPRTGCNKYPFSRMTRAE